MSGASDLLAHLRPVALDVDFEDRTYTIPAMDALEWLTLIEADQVDLYDIFPTLAGPQAIEHVEDAMWEGRVDRDQVGRVALMAVGAAADRPWWVATNIIGAAKGAWDIVHVNAAAGMSLAGWLDEVWTKIIERIDPKKKAAFVSDIEKVPKGWTTEVDFDDEERAFLAAMNAVMR